MNALINPFASLEANLNPHFIEKAPRLMDTRWASLFMASKHLVKSHDPIVDAFEREESNASI